MEPEDNDLAAAINKLGPEAVALAIEREMKWNRREHEATVYESWKYRKRGLETLIWAIKYAAGLQVGPRQEQP